MANQYKNKVVFGEDTLIDISGDTVDAAHLLSGYTAHDKSGAPITGTFTQDVTYTVTQNLTSVDSSFEGSKAISGNSFYAELEPTINNYVISSITVTMGGVDITDQVFSPGLGGKVITTNGTYSAADDNFSGYSAVTVNVPTGGSVSLQAKTATPTESVQTITADNGYDGLSSVEVGAVSSSYVGSGIDRRDETDLTASGATVTVPAGYYADTETKSVASGTVTAPSTISGTSATVSTGTNTLTLTKTVSVTPNVSTAGYISTGTAGNSSVSLTASVTTKAAATITPSTSDQTIAAGTYLTGAQTIAGDADLIASNIVSTANIFGVQGTVAIQHYYTGSSAPSSALGSNGDIYLQTGS